MTAAQQGRAGDCFAAAIPEPVRILGLRLLPLSLGRYRLLQRHGCTFVADESVPPMISDLFFGVLVCTMRCDQFNEFMDDDTAPPWWVRLLHPKVKTRRDWELRKWGKVIGKMLKREPQAFLIEKIKLFRDYLKVDWAVPQCWEDETDGATSMSGHWSHNLEVTLRSKLGWSEEEVNEAPLTKALADAFQMAVCEGLLKVVSAEELADGEANGKIIEAALASGAIPKG